MRSLEIPTPGYYTGQTALVGTLSVLALTVFFLVGDSWWQLALAGYFALLSTQLAVLGHDLGHTQIFRSSRTNHLLGVTLTNLGAGISFDWWAGRPGFRDTGEDPGRSWRSFPLLLLEAVRVRLSSVRHLFRRRARHRFTEAPLIVLHVLGYLTAVFLLLSVGKGLAFIALHQGLFGLYLGSWYALERPAPR